ncbi:MAG: phage integrase N-terminal SAM-like domain-containing protein [Desulfobulbaceae bacterium]|nr:phage integrase N-terminal SAM-like domain-containing protein [Desulfobulbaceae bacterium]
MMMEDRQLHGLAERTRQSYADAVKKFSEHFRQSPDTLDEEDIRNFFI